MSIFTMDLDRLTFSDIEGFLNEKIPENMTLDYKQQMSGGEQIAKGIAAFANTHGGLLLFGVGTGGGRDPEWPIEGMPHDPDFEKRVTAFCLDRISPPVTVAVGYVQNPSDGSRAFAVVRTGYSSEGPHVVDGTNIFVRRADNSMPAKASLSEIQILLDRRQRWIDLEDAHFREMLERVGVNPGEYTGTQRISLAVAPRFSNPAAIPWRGLRTVANGLEEVGLRGSVLAQARPYSQGLLCRNQSGVGFALTTRGALAYVSRATRQISDVDKRMTLPSLGTWAILAKRVAAHLSRECEHWGTFRVYCGASGHRNFQLIQKDPLGFDDELGTCIDDSIEFELEWSAPDVRGDSLGTSLEFFRRLSWSFGYDHSSVNDQALLDILTNIRA